MSPNERYQHMLANLTSLKESLEDDVDFNLISQEVFDQRLQVMTDQMDLVVILDKHRIDWAHLMKYVHTLTPTRTIGSATYDLSDAD